jgi:hypothetical protein
LRNVLSQKRDYYAGGLMSLIGIGVILEARHYNLGTLFHMGPGFFPIILGVTLTLIGILIAAVAVAATEGEASELFHFPNPQWRAWSCIIAGPVLFIPFGIYAGLVPATFVCVFVSALGDKDSTLKGSLILAAGVTVFGALLFSYVLQVSMPMWRWGIL